MITIDAALDKLRCVSCGNENLVYLDDTHQSFQCCHCGRVYESVWGVPYFGQFERDDILGLIEIAANASNRKQFGITPEVVESWEQMLTAYHQATDKPDFIQQNSQAQTPFLLNRYGEWLEVTHLLQETDLRDLQILDIGAGLGFDSHRLAMRGAKVTALEFSPLLAESGQIHFPHIEWIGGFSHCLPFKAGSFDAVFCNAALHHMRDIPAAISEALRVLRPGGFLITTCDSFRSNQSSDDAELEIFDREPAVLLGVNEGVPRLSEFLSVLQKYAHFVDVDLYTHTLYRSPLLGGTLSELTRWNFPQDVEMLSKLSGSMAMRVTLKQPWPEPALLQTDPILKAEDYASWLSSASLAMTNLASLMPDHYVDLPFPGRKGSKFELLNGWRLHKSWQRSRIAYQRGRWFLRRPPNAGAVIFEVGLPVDAPQVETGIDIMLNGDAVGCSTIVPGSKTRIVVDVSKISVGQVFVVEIHKKAAGVTLEEGAFEVFNRRFVITQSVLGLDQEVGASLESATVFAIIPVFNRLHFTQACIKSLKAQSYKSLQIVVSDGGSTDGTVDVIRREHPDVVVLAPEPETELWWTGAMAQGITYALRESQQPGDCVLMMNNDTTIPDDYVATLVGAAQKYEAAVGALIVDSRDPNRILDAGEYIDWASYAFPVKTNIDPDEQFCDDVDVLPGRGSLVPLRMIREVGNVDAEQLPHYLADYEFFCRLKKHGFKLGVCYETHILAHIEETGILPSVGVTSFNKVWQELFSRRSMNNVVDHWRFVGRHAPKSYRFPLQFRLASRVLMDLTLRTQFRPIFLPFYWGIRVILKIISTIKAQPSVFARFIRNIKQQGIDVLCFPHHIPGLIVIPLYLLACPGPIRTQDCMRLGVDVDQLLAKGILRPLNVVDWYGFNTLKIDASHQFQGHQALVATALNPFKKLVNTFSWGRATLAKRKMATE